MLKHLSDNERIRYDNACKARESEGRDLTAEEIILVQMLRHDWTHDYSDDASVARSGREVERRLKDLINDADLSADRKEALMRYFRMGSSSAEAELHREFGWLNWRGRRPAHGKLAIALSGRYNDEQWGEFERVWAKLVDIGTKLKAAHCPSRLIMTDDIPPFQALREIATRVREEENDPFFFGMAVPQDIQDAVDELVRVEKRTLVTMALDKEVLPALNLGSAVVMDLHQEHWLFKIQFSGAYYDSYGFFCCPHVTRPRNEWNKKPQESDRPQGKRPMGPREMSAEHRDRRDRHDRPRGSRDPEVGRVINESRRAVEDITPTYPRGQRPELVHYDDAPFRSTAKPAAPQVKRKIVPALSNRPLEVDTAPAKKKEKSAPKARAKSFTKVGSLADLAAALSDA